MALTITERPKTEAPAPKPPSMPPSRRRGRTALAWGVAIAAVAATGLLVWSVVDDGGGQRAPTIVERGDTKDHPRYQPTGVLPDTDVVRGDTKDHPRYQPTGIVPATDIERGDTKDHPLYRQPAQIPG